VKRLVLIIFFVEIGFVLTVAPWSAYWDRNYFAESLPLVRAAMTNNFVRGAITGLGIVNIGAAVADLVGMFMARSAARDDLSVINSHPAEE
jgi:hypothetical protein